MENVQNPGEWGPFPGGVSIMEKLAQQHFPKKEGASPLMPRRPCGSPSRYDRIMAEPKTRKGPDPLPRRNAELPFAAALPPQEYPEPRFTRDRYKIARSRISTPMPMRITPPSRPLRRERTVPNRRPRASPAMQMQKVTAAMMREDASAAAGP